MLNDRQYLIVDLLVKTNSSISAEDISKIVMKSKRTIMRDLSTVKLFLESNQIGELLVNVDGQGYRIKVDNSSRYEELMKKSIRDEELILFELINHPYVTMEQLADLLYVSKITASEKMNVIKENYRSLLNIEISHKGHTLHEPLHKKCVLISNLIDNNTKYYLDKAGIDGHAYEMLISQAEHMAEIREYFPNMLPGQIAHLFIAALLLEGVKETENNDDFSYLYQTSRIPYTGQAIAVLSKVSDACVSVNLGLSVNQILKVLTIIEEENSIRFQEEELGRQLYQHLKRILCYPTYLHAREIQNIANIKALYPFSFDLSIVFISLMEKLYGYQIPNRDLIGLYFAVGMENMRKKKSRILIYSSINSIANINKQLLEASLSNCEIIIADYLPDDQDEVTLVINGTREPLDHIENQFSTEYILSEGDIQLIRNQIENISINKNIQSIFPKDYSFTYDVQPQEAWLDVLKGICDRLSTALVISSEEAVRIVEREKSGNSLVISNFSIPHCISKKEDFCVSVFVHLSEAVQVENSSIQNVLVTLMSPTMSTNINIFKYLYRYLNQYETAMQGVTTYEEFIQFI